MPNSDKDRRTPEEIVKHYERKEKRRHKARARRIKVKDKKAKRAKRVAQVTAREIRRHKEYAERIRIRDEKRAKAKVKHLHRKGRWDGTYTAKQMADYHPWDL